MAAVAAATATARSVAVDHADVISLEWVLVRLAAHHSSLETNDGLVHHHAVVGVLETTKVLQVFHLTFEHGQVICKHLPVQFLPNILLPPVLLILLLPGVVDVTVELDELVPLVQVLAHVVHILLADLQEVLPTREIVKHDDTAHFVE